MQQEENRMLQSMYNEYQAVLRTVVYNYGIPYSEIDDIIQETYISYYKNYPLTWSDNQKKAMLMKIVKRKCIDYYRRNRYYRSISIDDGEVFDEAELLTKYILKDSLDNVINSENYKEIRECIFNMKKDWRNVAILYFVEERSIKEICELLEIQETVCRSRISRARKYLKEKLESMYQF